MASLESAAFRPGTTLRAVSDVRNGDDMVILSAGHEAFVYSTSWAYENMLQMEVWVRDGRRLLLFYPHPLCNVVPVFHSNHWEWDDGRPIYKCGGGRRSVSWDEVSDGAS